MADLGNLKQYQDDYDISFQVGNKKHKLKPSAEQILDFKRSWNDINDAKKRSDETTIWEFTAPLLGSSFDRETYRFGPDDNPDGEHHNLIPQLLDAGMDMDVLGRLLTSVHAKYFFGDDVAEELAKTGDLGKALRVVRQREEAKANPETPKKPGETNESD